LNRGKTVWAGKALAVLSLVLGALGLEPSMLPEEIGQGDFVQLKSGGPTMEVEGVDGFGRLICTYFEGPQFKKVAFNRTLLQKIEPAKHRDNDHVG